jgi:hypothetical protein
MGAIVYWGLAYATDPARALSLGPAPPIETGTPSALQTHARGNYLASALVFTARQRRKAPDHD